MAVLIFPDIYQFASRRRELAHGKGKHHGVYDKDALTYHVSLAPHLPLTNQVITRTPWPSQYEPAPVVIFSHILESDMLEQRHNIGWGCKI